MKNAIYSRREFGKVMRAGLPLSMMLRAEINSKIKGVQLGAQTYSFRSIPAVEIIPAMVKVGLGEVELMSDHCEDLAGAPKVLSGGRQMTPAQRETQRQQREAFRKWRMATSPETFKAF